MLMVMEMKRMKVLNGADDDKEFEKEKKDRDVSEFYRVVILRGGVSN
jgi:hypothetical protein